MHTALQLRAKDFRVEIAGEPCEFTALFPDWHPHDRFGVVVHEPFGAIGASHLIQTAIVSFYDVRPSRRAGRGQGLPEPNDVAIYPEIYVFHVGGRHGDYSPFDFWPARKEVFVASDAVAVLDAINDRAITRLAVPDGPLIPVEHEYKEPAAARDRIETVFGYSATGRVPQADVTISGLRPATEANPRDSLNPDRMRAAAAASEPTTRNPVLLQREWAHRVMQRAGEAQQGLELARARRAALKEGRIVRETYRRLSVDDALKRLVPNG